MYLLPGMVKLNFCIVRIKITPKYVATTIYGKFPAGITGASGCLLSQKLISVVVIMLTDGWQDNMTALDVGAFRRNTIMLG